MELAYPFTAEHELSPDELTAALGGKGAGLAAMTAAGLPVPPGFTLVTGACRAFLADGWSPELDRAVADGLEQLQTTTGKVLGDHDSPLLVSVRSGAAVSMPGMMDTVLNVGMTSDVERALARLSGDPEFAADTHRRALLSFAEVVLGADPAILAQAGAMTTPAEVAAALAGAGFAVDPDPRSQITAAIRAVFESWTSPRAVRYRDIEGIDSSIGTAVTVQSMVFGNLGTESGTGVALTRNPTTGDPGIMGDFLDQAQGEDVVAGGRLTRPLSDMGAGWPDLYRQLEA
ncbi:MAG: PEP/pyruvate-binding domain-containing protein, partial [Acidimicrobiales bacterium]